MTNCGLALSHELPCPVEAELAALCVVVDAARATISGQCWSARMRKLVEALEALDVLRGHGKEGP